MYTIIENPLWALPVELLNGITFALSYSAAISYAALITPTGAEGTLQGVVGTAYTGIGSIFIILKSNNIHDYLSNINTLYFFLNNVVFQNLIFENLN